MNIKNEDFLWKIPLLRIITSFLVFSTFFVNSYAQITAPKISDYDLNRENVLAFPGAEGFGRYASGGRGGQVLKVTNLNDSGPGSLREAIETSGPRIIVFEVSGNIVLQRPIMVRHPNLTIAGQTAPGDGITISNYWLNFVDMRNVIVRFLRFRAGDTSGDKTNPGYGVYMDNAIFDHCTFSWGNDETASFYAVRNFTLQWSIISEALNNSNHENGSHGYASITGGKNVSWHHNLLAHATQRMTMFDHSELYQSSQELRDWRGVTDFRNNVIYNWRDRASNSGAGGQFNLINNYFKPGPASLDKSHFLSPTSANGGYGKFFVSGNVLENNSTVNNNNWAGVRLENSDLTDRYLSSTRLSSPLASDVYEYNHSAQTAYQKVLDFAGASYVRDAVDTRIVNETKNGSFTYNGSRGSRYGIIDSQKDVGGWPSLRSNPAPADSDGDGMPDSWEIQNMLNPNFTNDKEYNLSPYYTDIEVYLNSLVQSIVDQTNPGVPAAVSLLAPIASATVSPLEITFSWSPNSTANLYRIQISKTSDFSSNTIAVDNIKQLSYLRNQLDGNSTYYWRVRASNESGTGSYSQVGIFKTGTTNVVPESPLLIAPINSVTGISINPTVSWSKVPNSTEYRLQVSTSSSFSSISIDQAGLSVNSSQLSNLNENTTYYWRVRASNNTGSSAYSATGIFRTASFGVKPALTILLRPAHNTIVQPTPVKLEWEQNPTAQEYRVQISTSSSFSSYLVNKAGVKDTFFHFENVKSNTTYYWKVLSVNRSGSSNSVKTYSFRTSSFSEVPKSILLNSPVDDANIFSSSINFSWDEPTATTYRLQVSTSESFSSYVANISGISARSYTVSNLSRNTQYYWRVIPSNEAGTGTTSETRRVRSATYSSVPTVPVRLSPSNNGIVAPNSITLNWKNEPSSEYYRIQISTSSSFSNIVSSDKVQGTSHMISELNDNATYYWRIRGENGAGVGSYSSAWTFKTQSGNSNLAEMVLISPNKDETQVSQFLSFTWQAYPNAQSYRIELSESSSFSSHVVNQSGLSSTSFAIGALKFDTRYYWRVTPTVNGSIATTSEVWSFTTAGSNVSSLTQGLVGHWKMDEGRGSTIVDHSGNSNNAALRTTSSVTWVEGITDQALQLPGGLNRYAVAPHRSNLNMTSGITISAWIRPNDVHIRKILTKTAPNGYQFGISSTGKVEFIFNESSSGSNYRLRSKASYPSNGSTWIHVAATFDGSSSKIYINGSLDNDEDYGNVTIGSNTSNLIIGALQDGGNRWRGALDDLRLYNRSLSAFEISMLAQENSYLQNISTKPNLVGHWKMDEGSGSVFIDQSGNSNNAIVQNTSGVTWIPGVDGQAVELSGGLNRFGLASHSSTLNIAGAITVSAWIRPNDQHIRKVLSKTGPNGYDLGIAGDGKVEFVVNSSTSGNRYRVRSNTSYPSNGNTWVHVTATFDGTSSNIYFDGQLDATINFEPVVIGTNTSSLHIGAIEGGNNRWFGGLDDVRLYNKALNSNEIYNLYATSQNSTYRQTQNVQKGPTTDVDSPQSVFSKEVTEDTAYGFKVFPNPVSDKIFIQLNSETSTPVEVWIYDMMGREYLQKKVMPDGAKIELDLTTINIAQGTYILLLNQGAGIVNTVKFIKK